MQRRITQAVLWAPALAAVVFLLVLVFAQGDLRAGLNAHADFASAPYLAQLVDEAPPGSTIYLGDYPWYEAFWLLRATIWLPYHHFVWQLVPFVLWFLTAVLAGFSVRRITGSRWAGITAAALVICGGVTIRGTMWSLNTHGPAAFHAALLGAALTGALSSRRWLHGVRGWGGALVIGAITAVGATDPLVLAVGIIPLLATALVLAIWRSDLAVLRLAGFVTGLAVVGSGILDRLAQDANISWTQKEVTFVAADQILGKLGLLPAVVIRLASEPGFSEKIEFPTAVAMAAGLLAIIVSITVLVVTVRVFKRAVWPERFGLAVAPIETVDVAADADADASDDDAPGAVRDAELRDPERVFVGGLTFWFSVVALNLVAFVFTSSAFDVFGGRYLVSGWIAICVLIPVLAVRLDLRWLAGVTATILAVASVYGLIRQPNPIADDLNFPSVGLANEVQKFTKANDASYGYAGFWGAAPITWHSRFTTRVYPVLGCGDGNNCRFYQHFIDSWYKDKSGRSFLVVDPSQPLQPNVDPAYGRPIATKRIGNVMVYVYDHDIAQQIG